MLRLGLDIGSTTVKAVLADEKGGIVFKSYKRHYSKIIEAVLDVLLQIEKDSNLQNIRLAISGSAGMGLSEKLSADFVQEVYATKTAIEKINGTGTIDAAIELGGEDAKILFLTGGLEVRMNGTCAGGTGAFIDQMASLLGVTADEINELSKDAKKIYPIASRCGVFAKSDIQPLINQGASKADLSKSILYAIVNQTVGGLAQGRKIKGNILYLGGPLTFFSQLRACFDEALGLQGALKENSLYYVAIGTALSADYECNLKDVIQKVRSFSGAQTFKALKPLFNDKLEYEEFKARHKRDIERAGLDGFNGNAYIGIDTGSTTIKAVIISEDGKILNSVYRNNEGNPVGAVFEYLKEIYSRYPDINLIAGASTGYGEDIIKNAFSLQASIVETAAHFIAAKKFMPDADFVIDIGGQDMKCFKIKNGAIDDIFLNEACSSGCGSFLKTIANSLNYSVEDFTSLALLAPAPVDLGSRCTVFMNSSIKQAQKDGASIENISAGLAVSVVKNALYKVIRLADPSQIGKNVVVQGGTFLSDAVLRAFELELNGKVVRPPAAELMGAYGAALYVKDLAKHRQDKGIISVAELSEFSYSVKSARCGLCTNNCTLSVNHFSNGRKYISGNKCERAVIGKSSNESLNSFDFKLNALTSFMEKKQDGKRGQIGLPLVLNMFELLPFWHTFFSSLGFECVVSPFSNAETFTKGQSTIPSDTVCFPAKLVHGHIQTLIEQGVKNIFYPCLSYNLDEKNSDNHYNCPVVAYYPQAIGISVDEVKNINFMQVFIDLNNHKTFEKRIFEKLKVHFTDLTLKEIKHATKTAFESQNLYMRSLLIEGERIIKSAREKKLHIAVLAGRPYHADPEVNHGIPQLLSGMGKAVVSEDCLPVSPVSTTTLNQWTYHARLYSAAEYVSRHKDMSLIQTISFGCGLDAVTSDEVRKILTKHGKLYTQLKIDEITNLGAVKIRLKSLFTALEQGQ